MFEKIPASNRWISLKCKDLLERKNQITAQRTNVFSTVLLGNNPCKYDIQNINVSCYLDVWISVYRTGIKSNETALTWEKTAEKAI